MSDKTKPKTETQLSRWGWVEASVWTERMLTALENGVKGGKWFSLMDKVYAPKTLKAAWKQVASNRGAAGVDGVSIQRFQAHEELYLTELHQALQAGTYQPTAVKRVYIPKGDGNVRPLGIPVVKDRIVQTALKLVIEPIFEKEFLPLSYGFRPEMGAKDALRLVAYLLKNGKVWAVDADIVSFFDTIPYERIREGVKRRVSDGRVLKLIESYLQQEIIEGMKRWHPVQGTPQGAVLSPLLSNISLHPLDQMMEQKGFAMIRYADDFIVLCESESEAQQALELIQGWMEANGLKLHPDKTRIGNFREQGQGFEFLGYRFEGGKRFVRSKSLRRLKDRIRSKTKRTRGNSLKQIIADLNPTLRGWFEYFKHAHRYSFPKIDGFVRRRLRAVLRKQKKRPGFGANLNDHKRWPNTFFANHGLFTLTEAWISASQSR